ncbi:MAG: type II secretion system protein [Nitrospirota bacterium]
MKNSKLGKLRILKFLILNSRSSRASGFTLLEVLIALAIISGLLVTLIYTLNYQLGLAGRHETLTIATLLAKNKLTEMEKNPESDRGFFGEPYTSYSYETTVKESPYFGVSEIVVVVRSDKEEAKFNEFIYKYNRHIEIFYEEDN